MIKEVENIILNKQYFELTAEELVSVNELVSSAEEFEEMKWFLISTQQAVVVDKIEPTPNLKKSVLEHLNKPVEKRKFWLNGVIPFMFPEDKRFYQKPAFQMSIAALLLIGFLFIYQLDMNAPQMAMNDSTLVIPEGTSELSGIVEEDGDELNESEEETVAAEIDDNLDVNTRTIDRVLTEEIIEDAEFEEIDEISHDGFFSGKLSDKDLKKIEDAKNTNSTNGVAFSTTVGNNDNGGNVNREDKANIPLAPTIVNAENNEVLEINDNIYSNNDYKISSDDKKDKRKGSKKDVLRKKKDPVIYNESANKPEIEQNLNAGGAFDNNTYRDEDKYVDDDADITVTSLKEKEAKEIKAYNLHVDETKELKKLFTVFK